MFEQRYLKALVDNPDAHEHHARILDVLIEDSISGRQTTRESLAERLKDEEWFERLKAPHVSEAMKKAIRFLESENEKREYWNEWKEKITGWLPSLRRLIKRKEINWEEFQKERDHITHVLASQQPLSRLIEVLKKAGIARECNKPWDLVPKYDSSNDPRAALNDIQVAVSEKFSAKALKRELEKVRPHFKKII